MRLLLLALVLLPSAALAGERAPSPVASKCPRTRPQMADAPATTLKVRPLSQEPSANQYIAVLRLENGCEKLVMIREDVGGRQH